MPLPDGLDSAIVSGNVSFMGRAQRFASVGSAGQAVAVTFGQYPWLAISAFSVAAQTQALELRAIPQPDKEPFGVAAQIKTLTMPLTANYVDHPVHDPETFSAAAQLKSLTMAVVANYVDHPVHDPETFGIFPIIKSITMAVTANYAEHEVHDPETFGVSAQIKSLTMSVV